MEYTSPLNATGIRCYNVPGLGEKISSIFHISSAVVIPANTATVVTSGQTGYNADMKLPTDLTEEVLNAFRNVEESLAAAGVKDGFSSVYQMTSYHTGGLGDDTNAALDVAVTKYFKGNRPAWAGIGVDKLTDGARIEITAWAALKN